MRDAVQRRDLRQFGPHPSDHHYHVIAHRCGYEDDLHAYTFEHEVVHELLWERLLDRQSPVLWALAHITDLAGSEAAFEALSVQAFQAYLRGNVQQIAGGVDWLALKRTAQMLLAAS